MHASIYVGIDSLQILFMYVIEGFLSMLLAI